MLTLQESFNNVKIVCDGVTVPGLDNTQRQVVNESLQNIAGGLQAYELMLQEDKKVGNKPEIQEDKKVGNKPEIQEDEPDEDKD